MSSFIGRTFRLLYNLRHHVWGGLTLNTWLVIFLLVLALLFYSGILPGGVVLMASSLVGILLLLIGQWWASSHFYVRFDAEEAVKGAGSTSVLGPKDKVLLRASGVFAVEGEEKRFTDLIAYYRTFETREHSIMARQTPSRFLGLGRSKSDLLGMWYIFFVPENLNAVTPGRLYFGSTPHPALRLDYMRINPKGKAKTSVAYLSFETELSMQQVLEDLLLDRGGAAAK